MLLSDPSMTASLVTVQCTCFQGRDRSRTICCSACSSCHPRHRRLEPLRSRAAPGAARPLVVLATPRRLLTRAPSRDPPRWRRPRRQAGQRHPADGRRRPPPAVRAPARPDPKLSFSSGNGSSSSRTGLARPAHLASRSPGRRILEWRLRGRATRQRLATRRRHQARPGPARLARARQRPARHRPGPAAEGRLRRRPP